MVSYTHVEQEIAVTRVDDGDVAAGDTFVTEHLRCAICTYVETDWALLSCGHRYCFTCICTLLSSGRPRKCPECRKPVFCNKITPARDANRLASNLPVYCCKSARNNGCKWKGPFESRLSHLESCPLQDVLCKYEGCDVHYILRDERQHAERCPFRPIECSNHGCSLKFPWKARREIRKHAKTCPKKIIECKKCRSYISNDAMEKHTRECPEALVNCLEKRNSCAAKRSHADLNHPLEEFGVPSGSLPQTCSWRGKRRRLASHRATCSAHAVHTLTRELCDRREERNSASTYIWDVTAIKPIMYKFRDVVGSPEFYLLGKRYRLYLYPQGRHASQSYDILLICFDPVPLTSTDNNARASDAPAPTQPSGPQREFGPSRPQPESEVSRAQPASEVSREVSRAQPESEVS
eukprot:Rmarinus@m.2265